MYTMMLFNEVFCHVFSPTRASFVMVGNSRYVGRAFKDAARRAAGKGTDDFLGHAVLELHRIPRGGLFMHRLPMLRRSKKSHVGGYIEITAKFSVAGGTESRSPLVSDHRRFAELMHRIVLCEAPIWQDQDRIWDCSVSKWAHTLLTHAVLAGGLSPCQTLSCELDSLTFCNKVIHTQVHICFATFFLVSVLDVRICMCAHTSIEIRTQNPDIPDVLGEKVTNVLSKLLSVAANDTLSPADVDLLTTAVTNQLAERAEDLQSVVPSGMRSM